MSGFIATYQSHLRRKCLVSSDRAGRVQPGQKKVHKTPGGRGIPRLRGFLFYSMATGSDFRDLSGCYVAKTNCILLLFVFQVTTVWPKFERFHMLIVLHLFFMGSQAVA